MDYWEIKLVTGDTFRTSEEPATAKSSKTMTISDIDRIESVLIYTQHVVYIHKVTDEEIRLQKKREHDEMVETTMNVTMDVLGGLFGGRKEEPLTIENKQTE